MAAVGSAGDSVPVTTPGSRPGTAWAAAPAAHTRDRRLPAAGVSLVAGLSFLPGPLPAGRSSNAPAVANASSCALVAPARRTRSSIPDQGRPAAIRSAVSLPMPRTEDTPSRMAGYWEAPEATAEVVSDGWLDSGDLARADADGYLWFFGRKKQVIVHDGSNISPYEVEGALVDHPAITLAGAVGVHDTVHGENVRAYVTLAEGAEQPSAADLIVHCRERIGYKAPEEVVFLPEMPLNPTGKIDRVGLKRMAEDHLHPHGLT